MPELPEVENVRRSLLPVIGCTVTSVHLRRREVITGMHSPAALLAGATIRSIERRGKELLLLTDGRALGVHLGMTGTLRYRPLPAARQAPTPTHEGRFPRRDKHVHVLWRLQNHGVIEFRDPRRFGGIWTFLTADAAKAHRWQRLGPDACLISAADLFSRLQRTRRAIKAALLDQHVLAGVGNIYADELLFTCRMHPTTPASRLTSRHVRHLVATLRRLLARAIAAGGSSVRDYTDASGGKGSFQLSHRVYGRCGQPCRRCRTPLQAIRVGGRTSTFCSQCQTVLEIL